ncbi:MAG TPA: hypothetical protein VIJ28_09885 [Chloroflexota bacterium]|jgi:hypothetical protein
MATPTQTTKTSGPVFNARELRTLRDLRARYQQDRDLFTPREAARLRFIRWLVRSGRLIP